jgi:hypothetical protein
MSESMRNSESTNPWANAAKTSLRFGVVAGPLFLLIFALQIPLRPDFNFARSEPSWLSLGPLGWIQIANCMLTGLMVVAAAPGMRKALRSGKGAFWGPLLLTLFGICHVGTGVFVVDSPHPVHTTLHGTLHIVFGSVGFIALIAACFVYTRAFLWLKQKGIALFSAVTGALFLATFFLAASASQNPQSIQLFLNLIMILEWVWVSLISRQILRRVLTPAD